MPAGEWAEHTDRAARVVEASAGVLGAIAPAFNVLADAFRAFGWSLADLSAEVMTGMESGRPARRRYARRRCA
jgi:hypothetical protein